MLEGRAPEDILERGTVQAVLTPAGVAQARAALNGIAVVPEKRQGLLR